MILSLRSSQRDRSSSAIWARCGAARRTSSTSRSSRGGTLVSATPRWPARATRSRSISAASSRLTSTGSKPVLSAASTASVVRSSKPSWAASDPSRTRIPEQVGFPGALPSWPSAAATSSANPPAYGAIAGREAASTCTERSRSSSTARSTRADLPTPGAPRTMMTSSGRSLTSASMRSASAAGRSTVSSWSGPMRSVPGIRRRLLSHWVKSSFPSGPTKYRLNWSPFCTALTVPPASARLVCVVGWTREGEASPDCASSAGLSSLLTSELPAVHW